MNLLNNQFIGKTIIRLIYKKKKMVRCRLFWPEQCRERVGLTLSLTVAGYTK